MTSGPRVSGMSLNVLASAPNSWMRRESVSRLCAAILTQIRFCIAEFGAPCCRGFRIVFSTLRDPNVSLCSPCFTMRATSLPSVAGRRTTNALGSGDLHVRLSSKERVTLCQGLTFTA
jgi:hypothetical protein